MIIWKGMPYLLGADATAFESEYGIGSLRKVIMYSHTLLRMCVLHIVYTERSFFFIAFLSD